MGILPEKRSQEDGPPPVVAYWRDVIRASRFGRFVARHKAASAAVAGLYALWKVWKWFVVDLVRWGTHPGASFRWATHHAALALGISAAVFLVAFVVTRFGLDWLTPDDDPPPPDEREHWSRRPGNRHSQTHVPRGL